MIKKLLATVGLRDLSGFLFILFAFSILPGCGGDNGKILSFDPDSLKTSKQNYYFHLDYLGKDTFVTQAIYAKDRNHLYRIKARFLFYSQYDSSFLQLAMDSTFDGGKTWQPPIDVGRFKVKELFFNPKSFNIVQGFYVNGNFNKYVIVNHRKIYYAEAVKFDLLEPELDVGYITNVFNDEKSNALIAVGTKYIRIRNKTIVSYRFENNPRYSNCTFHRDTLYLYFHPTEFSPVVPGFKAGENALIKIDTNGRVTDRIVLPKGLRADFDNIALIHDGNYTVVGTFRNDYSSDSTHIYFSDDYGKSWDLMPINSIGLYDQLKYFERDHLLVSERNASFQITTDFGKSFLQISDSTLLSDSIKEIETAPTSNGLFVIGEGNHRSDNSHLFYPTLQDASFFDGLSWYKVEETPNKIYLTIGLQKGKDHSRRYNMKVSGTTFFNNNNQIITDLKLHFKPTRPDSLEWKTEFSPLGMDLHPGDAYNLVVYFADHTKEERYTLPKRTFTPVSFYQKHPGFVTAIVCIGAILVVFFLLLLLQPMWLYALYKKTSYLRNLAEVTGTAGKLFSLIDKLTITPLFVLQPRVADAWIKKHKQKLTDCFIKQATVAEHQSYVPLPLRIQSATGTEIEKPSPDLLSEYFKGSRVCIEIVGPGGVGKTTLAIQLGFWTMHINNRKFFKGHLWIPVLIEEESDDVFSVIKNIITSYTGEQTDDHFINYLLKKQRLLIIVDALSERSVEMQEHIRHLYAKNSINALLITTRTPINVLTGEDIHFYPQTMDFVKVGEYVKSVLINRKEEVFKSETNRSRLSDKIVSIFKIGNKEIQILPVLATLMMKEAVSISACKEATDILYIIDRMSSTIPDVFFGYILSVNPKTGENLFNDEEMLKYAEVIALASLGDNLIPGDVLQSIVLTKLQSVEPSVKSNVIDRLVKNGILSAPRRYGTDIYLRFALDPLAEYLGAFAIAKHCAGDKDKWNKIFKEAAEKKAFGFKAALEITQLTYADRFGWWK